MSVEEMEGQQPTSPEEKKVNGRSSHHPSNPHQLFHPECDFLNTNRTSDPGTEQQQVELQLLSSRGQ